MKDSLKSDHHGIRLIWSLLILWAIILEIKKVILYYL